MTQPDEALVAALEHRLTLLESERARIVAKYDRRIEEARADLAATRPPPPPPSTPRKRAARKKS